MTTTAVRERPILFSGAMVRAILADQKTQTRRVIRPQPNEDELFAQAHGCCHVVDNRREFTCGKTTKTIGDAPIFMCSGSDGLELDALLSRCPYGDVGDRLWVREAWRQGTPAYNGPDFNGKVCYRADKEHWPKCRWRPSIHMPRWASRITLEIVGVGIERVQEISIASAVYEGVAYLNADVPGGRLSVDAKRWFRELWDSINAKRGYGWDRNPWVWAIEFKMVKP